MSVRRKCICLSRLENVGRFMLGISCNLHCTHLYSGGDKCRCQSSTLTHSAPRYPSHVSPLDVAGEEQADLPSGRRSAVPNRALSGRQVGVTMSPWKLLDHRTGTGGTGCCWECKVAEEVPFDNFFVKGHFVFVSPGVGFTKAPFVNFSVSKIIGLVKAPVKFFESHSYLSCVTAAQLRRHLSNINVICNR